MVVRGLSLPSAALRPKRRLDSRALAATALIVAGLAGSAIHWGTSNDTSTVVELARDLPAGAVLQPGDLAVARVRLDPAAGAAVVSGNARDQIVGQTLNEPGYAHALLFKAQLARRPVLDAEHVAFSFPIDPDHAAGGRLASGDVVAVYAVPKNGTASASSVLVVDGVRVLAVGYNQPDAVVAASTAGAPALRSLTLAVTEVQVQALALAEATGTISVARHGASAEAGLTDGNTSGADPTPEGGAGGR